ncbi:hypothetical protein KCV06_g7739, partial [Aureobasidium melanogenum]
SQLKTGHPVRSAIHKQLNGRLVLRWVTTWESLLLYVLHLLFLLQLDQFLAMVMHLLVVRPLALVPVPQQTEQQRQTQYQHDVTLLGCVSWAYSALYAPTVATMWLIKNWKRSDISPWLKILKSFEFAATAGSFTVDTKNRYAMWLARRLGNWAGALFNLVSATSLFLLATVFMILFTHSVADIFKSASINDLRIYIYQ